MPRVNIEYSPVYDEMIHRWQNVPFENAQEKAADYISRFEAVWRPVEGKVFESMQRVSGLSWKGESIDCFIVQNSKPFSRPLTLPMKKDLLVEAETLIHELTHNILVQNNNRLRRIEYPQYAPISKITYVHIKVHAILKPILIDVFGDEKTTELIKLYDLVQDYKKAWEIVEKETPQKIIKDHVF